MSPKIGIQEARNFTIQVNKQIAPESRKGGLS